MEFHRGSDTTFAPIFLPVHVGTVDVTFKGNSLNLHAQTP
jgi:hypothetical protein